MKESLNLMERMGLINEKSINAKKREINRVENFFKKGNNNLVKCFAVLTAENPDSTKHTASFNQKANDKLFKELKTQYTIIPSQGKFGNVENSFLVINITQAQASYFCGKNEQTSFVYCYIDENGQLISEYWEKENTELPYHKKTNPYVLKDTSNDWVDMSGADDYYTIVGNKFKFSIPFSIFESVANCLDKKLVEVSDKDKYIKWIMEGVGYGGYYNRVKYVVKDNELNSLA